jgi:hypothetical protein
MVPEDHVYLGAFGHTISSQIVLPSICRIPRKITQRKDARIRFLLKIGFCHVFQDVAKGMPDHHFHVGDPQRGHLSDSIRQSVSDRDYRITPHNRTFSPLPCRPEHDSTAIGGRNKSPDENDSHITKF